MKFNIIPALIAVALSALVAFGMYNWCRYQDMNLLVAIVGGISMALTCGLSLGISFVDKRKGINTKVMSSIFAFLALIINVIFCCLSAFSAPAYIITISILILIWLLVIYSIVRA
ncbi:MAG: hypothetical protein ACI30B_03770 [Paludibacteraceae bacterium]